MRQHIQSLGEVFGHVARVYAWTSWLLRHTDDELHAHDAWFHLAQVVGAYAELIEDVTAGRVRLPFGWCEGRGLDPESAR
ncbi:hypothetical protein DFR70_11149 [Nocardia tenerifensis]|uniref:Uncharacterized protein n=1 Tax=Nocardia tenerifensis TaxID=228006 RepID=A0A318JY72_9NOCA|nr:hypothetical protein [Nocardia tenerifensis]PXX59667.1 hypothetical protein DFR70_11149 [Nocardia tenerifensis]